MNGHMERRSRWPIVVTAVIAAALIGWGAFQLGVSHGLAIGGSLAAVPPGAVVPYGWHRPRFGFGFFLFPFLFFGFWFLVLRAIFWGRPWRRCYGGDGYASRLDEWHRRAHERMSAPPAP